MSQEHRRRRKRKERSSRDREGRKKKSRGDRPSRSRRKKRSDQIQQIGQYQLGDLIGSGGFGKVYKGMNLETGEFVAIKSVPIKELSKSELRSTMMEIDLLRKLDHDNVVKYLGSFKSRSHLYIILEFIENGSLLDIVKKFGKINEKLVAKHIHQTLCGLEYLHEQGVIHRDIKGANLLTTKESVIKLTDFGVSAKLGDQVGSKNDALGTPYWMAPEVIEMHPASTACDIWSVGCTAIELLDGAPPYFSLGPIQALYRIVQDDIPPIPDFVSPSCRSFLEECFQKDPSLRSSATEMLSHNWIQSVIDKPKQEDFQSKLARFKENYSEDSEDEDQPLSRRIQVPTSHPEMRMTGVNMDKFMEEDSDDFGDLELDDGEDIHLNKQRDFSDTALNLDIEIESQPHRGDKMKRSNEIVSLIGKLSGDDPESVLETCNKLIELFKANPSMRDMLITYHGVIPIMDLLEVENSEVQHAILRVVNTIIADNSAIQENLCLVGGIPSITKLSSDYYSNEIRHEAAHFVHEMCHTSPLTLQMFIACRGLPVLVDFLKMDFSDNTDLIKRTIDDIDAVFNLKGPTPKNDFCRMFAKCGLLDPLSTVFKESILTKQDQKMITTISTIFERFSHGDSVVKVALSQVDVIQPILAVLPTVSAKILVILVKIFRNTSVSMQQSVSSEIVQNLQEAGAIESVVAVWETIRKQRPPELMQVESQILTFLSNMTKISAERREEVSRVGAIPLLTEVIREDNALKQFALQIICDLPKATGSRYELMKNNSVDFFIEIMSIPYWRVRALGAISHLMEDQDILSILKKKKNSKVIVSLFETTTDNNLSAMLMSFIKIIEKEPNLAPYLIENDIFQFIVPRLTHNDALIRQRLLKACLGLLRGTDSPLLKKKFPLADIKKMANSRIDKVLVIDVARRVLTKFNEITERND